MTGIFNGEYKQMQWIKDTDTRSFDERMASLPFVRDEDLPEWQEWANRAFPEAHRYVNNHR
jgi:hypothetical protein